MGKVGLSDSTHSFSICRSWDPKETWALITWLFYAVYLHGRIYKDWSPKKTAAVSASGFVIVWICYVGVNLFGVGLHSYGFFSK